MHKAIYFGLLLAVAVHAQEERETEEGIELLLETAVEPEEYRLDAGDSLLVLISGPVSYSYPTLVTPTGELLLMVPTRRPGAGFEEVGGSPLNLEVVGRVRVSGQAIAQAQASLGKALSRYFRGATSELVLIAPRRFKVYVLGGVRAPGAYIASPFTRISDLIQKAGGITPAGARHRVELKLSDGSSSIADLPSFELSGDFRYNPRVEAGMVVFVPPWEQLVRVRGALQGPELSPEASLDTLIPPLEQTYDLKEGETFLDLVLRAGGPSPHADLRHCSIERPSENNPSGFDQIPVDLYEILTEGEKAHNPVLRPGDLVVVPFLPRMVYVVGEVGKPGALAYYAGYKVTDYIGLAGGPTPDADLGRVEVIRADGRVFSARDNPPIRSGDTILVPTRAARAWAGFITIGSVVISTVFGILALTR